MRYLLRFLLQVVLVVCVSNGCKKVSEQNEVPQVTEEYFYGGREGIGASNGSGIDIRVVRINDSISVLYQTLGTADTFLFQGKLSDTVELKSGRASIVLQDLISGSNQLDSIISGSIRLGDRQLEFWASKVNFDSTSEFPVLLPADYFLKDTLSAQYLKSSPKTNRARIVYPLFFSRTSGSALTNLNKQIHEYVYAFVDSVNARLKWKDETTEWVCDFWVSSSSREKHIVSLEALATFAHENPVNFVRGLNIDFTTNTIIDICDIVNCTETYVKFVSQYCRNHGSDLEGYNRERFLESIRPKRSNFSNWTLARSGIKYIFDNVYPRAPYTVTIPFDSLKVFLKQ